MTHARGFSLMEVLIVLAIVGILSAAAYPNYASYMVRARRAEAQVALIEAMQREERYFTRHNSYIAFSATGEDAEARLFRWHSGATAPRSGYELRAEACEGGTLAECVVIRALPGTANVDSHFRDPDCGALALRSSGEHAASGPASNCWP